MPTLETLVVDDPVAQALEPEEDDKQQEVPVTTTAASTPPPSTISGKKAVPHKKKTKTKKVTPASHPTHKKQQQQQQQRKAQPSIASFFAKSVPSPKATKKAAPKVPATTTTVTATVHSNDKLATAPTTTESPTLTLTDPKSSTTPSSPATTSSATSTSRKLISTQQLRDIVMGPPVKNLVEPKDMEMTDDNVFSTEDVPLRIPRNPGLGKTPLSRRRTTTHKKKQGIATTKSAAEPLTTEKAPQETVNVEITTTTETKEKEAPKEASVDMEITTTAENKQEEQAPKETVDMEITTTTENKEEAPKESADMEITTSNENKKEEAPKATVEEMEAPKESADMEITTSDENKEKEAPKETVDMEITTTTENKEEEALKDMVDMEITTTTETKEEALKESVDTESTAPTENKKEAPKESEEAPNESGEVEMTTTAMKKMEEASKAWVGREMDQTKKSTPALLPAQAAALAQHRTLLARYTQRRDELLQRGRHGLPEEDFSLDVPVVVDANSAVSAETALTEFPSAAVATLLCVVQESSLTLSQLTARALTQLQESFAGLPWTTELVSSKIKVVATRESYLSTLHHNSTLDVFENDEAQHMWRWEVVALEVMPPAQVALVKKARTARRKLKSHVRALAKLLQLLEKAVENAPAASSDLTKISTQETKVLKFEREEEKSRLAEEAKRAKERAKQQKLLEKEEEKKKKLLQKEEEKKKKLLERQREKDLKLKSKQESEERKKKEREEKKLEAARLKTKKQEEEEKTEADRKRKLAKQQSGFKQFFVATKSPSPKKAPAPTCSISSSHSAASDPTAGTVDSDTFWSQVNAGLPDDGRVFSHLSPRAKSSRRRRTRTVPVTVYVTVLPDNPFHQQPYAEQQTIRVPNKFKYLHFHEDCRPPYHGTWSKGKSPVVTGANPFGQDTQYLDYDVDSEAEWEEGDDELGEDVENDAEDDEEPNMDEEEGDTRAYNFQDGWLAQDDDLGDEEEEIDDDTKLLRQKKLQSSDPNGQKAPPVDHATICLVAPMAGGIPFGEEAKIPTECVEGVDPLTAREIMSSHCGQVLESMDLCLDAFPPPLVEEGLEMDLTTGTQGGPGAKPSNQEMSRDDLKVFAEFVHHCTLPSKDRVVEELRTAHKTVTSSRAQATRKLDAIAAKRRHPSGGVFWEVKREILQDLGLEELLKKQLELPAEKSNEGENKTASGVMSKHDLQVFCRFVHHCTLPSKDRVVEELRAAHETVTSSRAQALRKLDAIAVKKRNPAGGVVWEVKPEVLEELGLQDLMNKQLKLPVASPPAVLATAKKPEPNRKAAKKDKASAKKPDLQQVGKGSTPVAPAGKTKSPRKDTKQGGEKRKAPVVSEASKKLFAGFLKHKKQKTSSS